MKKILIAIAFASIAAFADTSIPANIQRLIDAKDWNALSTNNFNRSIVKTFAIADADALIEASIQNKRYFNAFQTAVFNSSLDKFIAACTALSNNNFIDKQNGTYMNFYYSSKMKTEAFRETALALIAKIRQVLAADVPTGVKLVDVYAMCNYIFAMEEFFNVDKLPIQISDSMIALSAINYNKLSTFAVKSTIYEEHYTQIYEKYFAALPENSDLATRKNVTWEKLVFFNWLNKYYGDKFNDVLFAKSDINGKIYIAVQTCDADKLLIALQNVKQDTLDPETATKIIAVLNGQPADWRTADVVKALKNINSMYTIKLYDNRDAWEPILSKIRAMLEVRQ